MTSTPMSHDARFVLAAQALRAFAYGFGAVLIGVTLSARGFSSTEIGVVLAAIVAGTALASVVIGRRGDRFGRRRCYVVLYLLLAVTGVAFAFADRLWLLVVVALTGALSTEVVESGPFTSLEQSMLATEEGPRRMHVYSRYNAIATAAGAVGALASGLPGLLQRVWSNAPSDQTWFLLFVPVAIAGAVVAGSLSKRVEAPRHANPARRVQLHQSKRTVVRLSGLFALDSFGGGFVVQAFIAYWLTVKYGAALAGYLSSPKRRARTEPPALADQNP